MGRRDILGFGIAALVAAFPHDGWSFGNCSFQSVVGVAFGPYNTLTGSAVDSTGSLTYRCSGQPSPVTIDLSRGNAPTYDPRYMLNAGEQMNYNLYRDSGWSQIWGDGSSGTFHYTATPPKNTNITVTIYGQIDADQDVVAGAYADTIIATISW